MVDRSVYILTSVRSKIMAQHEKGLTLVNKFSKDMDAQAASMGSLFKQQDELIAAINGGEVKNKTPGVRGSKALKPAAKAVPVDKTADKAKAAAAKQADKDKAAAAKAKVTDAKAKAKEKADAAKAKEAAAKQKIKDKAAADKAKAAAAKEKLKEKADAAKAKAAAAAAKAKGKPAPKAATKPAPVAKAAPVKPEPKPKATKPKKAKADPVAEPELPIEVDGFTSGAANSEGLAPKEVLIDPLAA